jgi:hypothetical protein
LIPIFGFLLSPFLMCVCVFQPRTICFQYIRICFSLERKCVFDLIILILIILVSYLGDWSSRGTRRRCENRQVVANCAIIPRNLILAFIFLFLFLTIISDMEFALGTKKKKRERCDIPDGRQYPRKNIETKRKNRTSAIWWEKLGKKRRVVVDCDFLCRLHLFPNYPKAVGKRARCQVRRLRARRFVPPIPDGLLLYLPRVISS